MSLIHEIDYGTPASKAEKQVTLSVDGKQVAEGVIEHTAIMTAGLGETFDTGRDTGATVVDYPGSNAFTGEIDRIEVKQTLAAPRR